MNDSIDYNPRTRRRRKQRHRAKNGKPKPDKGMGEKRYLAHMHKVQIRRELCRIQNWRCFYCAVPLYEFTATYDHIETVKDGGAVSLDNGVASCKKCNWLRGDMPFDEFCEDQGITMKRPRHKADRFKFLCELG